MMSHSERPNMYENFNILAKVEELGKDDPKAAAKGGIRPAHKTPHTWINVKEGENRFSYKDMYEEHAPVFSDNSRLSILRVSSVNAAAITAAGFLFDAVDAQPTRPPTTLDDNTKRTVLKVVLIVILFIIAIFTWSISLCCSACCSLCRPRTTGSISCCGGTIICSHAQTGDTRQEGSGDWGSGVGSREGRDCADGLGE